MKVFFSNPQVFADVFNFWLYDGMQYIRPENLKEVFAAGYNLKEATINEELDDYNKIQTEVYNLLKMIRCAYCCFLNNLSGKML